MEIEAISVQITLNTHINCDKLEEISNLEILLNASTGHWKRCGGPHVARRPTFAHPSADVCHKVKKKLNTTSLFISFLLRLFSRFHSV